MVILTLRVSYSKVIEEEDDNDAEEEASVPVHFEE
jgi:hypothetical protein